MAGVLYSVKYVYCRVRDIAYTATPTMLKPTMIPRHTAASHSQKDIVSP